MRSAARQLVLLLAVFAALLWLADLVSAGDIVIGPSPAHRVIEWAAVANSAAFVIALVTHLIFTFAPPRVGRERTGLERTLVYAAVTFPVAFGVLRFYGLDLTSVLAGSAIATAAVGFAMQPTLGSLIAGLTLQFDQSLRVGDAVIYDGEAVRVTRLEWRTVVGRKRDGRTVVFPNGALASGPLEVIPADASIRGAFSFAASAAEPPTRVCDIVRELVEDLPLVDAAAPVVVSPISFSAEETAYEAAYWTRAIDRRSEIEAEAMSRLWRQFQRHGVAFRAGAKPPGPEPAADAAAAQTLAGEAAQAGRLLLYAPGERLVAPAFADGWRLLPLRGDVAAGDWDGAALDRSARVARMAEAIVRRIGPYGRYAVARAAESTADLGELASAVAAEIDDADARAAFLAELGPEPMRPAPLAGPLTTHRDAAGRLLIGGRLRAASEVAIWAYPLA